MSTSQEIIKHFGKNGLITIQKELQVKNCIEINKNSKLKKELSEMIFSWYVDYGRKKFPYDIQDLIHSLKNK